MQNLQVEVTMLKSHKSYLPSEAPKVIYSLSIPSAFMMPIEATFPWENARVDFVASLPRTSRGNAHILVFERQLRRLLHTTFWLKYLHSKHTSCEWTFWFPGVCWGLNLGWQQPTIHRSTILKFENGNFCVFWRKTYFMAPLYTPYLLCVAHCPACEYRRQTRFSYIWMIPPYSTGLVDSTRTCVVTL